MSSLQTSYRPLKPVAGRPPPHSAYSVVRETGTMVTEASDENAQDAGDTAFGPSRPQCELTTVITPQVALGPAQHQLPPGPEWPWDLGQRHVWTRGMGPPGARPGGEGMDTPALLQTEQEGLIQPPGLLYLEAGPPNPRPEFGGHSARGAKGPSAAATPRPKA